MVLIGQYSYPESLIEIGIEIVKLFFDLTDDWTCHWCAQRILRSESKWASTWHTSLMKTLIFFADSYMYFQGNFREFDAIFLMLNETFDPTTNT